MCTSGDVQYIGEISLVHWGGGGGGGGNIMSTLGDVQQMMYLGEQLDKSFQFLLKTPMYS